jgi:uncharacterized membrane protein
MCGLLFAINSIKLKPRTMNMTSILNKFTNEEKLNVGKTERYISIATGAFLFATGVKNLKRKPVRSAFRIASGSAMLHRGLSGYCAVNEAIGRNSAKSTQSPTKIEETITVKSPREEVYNYWRKLENLPKFMKHLKTVQEIDSKKSHWEASLIGGMGTIKWDAKILSEQPGTLISWRSLRGAVVENMGNVRFVDGKDKNTTDIHVTISYQPPAGDIGQLAARLLNPAFESMIRADVRRFGEMVESGEISFGGQQKSVGKSQPQEANQ